MSWGLALFVLIVLQNSPGAQPQSKQQFSVVSAGELHTLSPQKYDPNENVGRETCTESVSLSGPSL